MSKRSPAPTPAPTIPTPATAAARLRAAGAALAARYIDREEVFDLLLHGLIAQQHVLLLGPPGTAKSAAVLDFAAALGLRSFVRLLGRTTTPEELWGPLDIQGLRAGRYERLGEGYLPTAQVAFLDEVFKASSPILNSLLTALNEGQWDNGQTRQRLPLRLAVGASNELPEAGAGLEALYDRFVARAWVGYVEPARFEAMLGLDVDGPPPAIDPADVAEVTAAARAVDVRPVLGAVGQARRELDAAHGVVASDRRWRQGLRLVAASAALDGRSVARARDLTALGWVLWQRPEDLPAVREVLAKHEDPAVVALRGVLEQAQGLLSGLGDSPDQKAIIQAFAAWSRLETAAKAALASTEHPLDERVEAMAARVRAAKAALDRHAAGFLGSGTRI